MKRGYRELRWLPKFILLKPEPEDPDDERAQELAENEREYHKNPPAVM